MSGVRGRAAEILHRTHRASRRREGCVQRSIRSLWPQTPSIMVVTGAGISRESGLAMLRDAEGIWANVRIEDVATSEAFARDPARVQAFYNARRHQLQDPAVKPNAAHEAPAPLASARDQGFESMFVRHSSEKTVPTTQCR